jgi:hypothetical protein
MSEHELAVKLDALLAEYAEACTLYGGAAEMWKAAKQHDPNRDTSAMESAAARAEAIREKIITLIPPAK